MKKDRMKEYPEVHQLGTISFENQELFFPGSPDNALIEGDLGIQIAKDGRIWMCINGIAFVRFRPTRTEDEEKRIKQIFEGATRTRENLRRELENGL